MTFGEEMQQSTVTQILTDNEVREADICFKLFETLEEYDINISNEDEKRDNEQSNFDLGFHFLYA